MVLAVLLSINSRSRSSGQGSAHRVPARPAVVLQPLKVALPVEGRASWQRFSPALRTGLGWEVDVSFLPYTEIGDRVLESTETLGRAFYDGCAVRFGLGSRVRIDPLQSKLPLGRRPCPSQLCLITIPRRWACDNSATVDLVNAGMVEPLDAYVANDKRLEWNEFLR